MDALAGIIVYCILWVCVAAMVGYSALVLTKATNQEAANVYFGFILSFATSRVVWIFLAAYNPRGYAEFILNRVCFALFFSAFTVVAFFWIEMYSNIKKLRLFNFHRRRTVCVSTNVFLWLFQVAFVIVFLVNHNSGQDLDSVYDANIITICVMALIIAVLFLIYGARISLTFYRSAISIRSNAERKNVLLKIVFTAVIFVVCFGVRVAFFAYRPATDEYLPVHVFHWFAYYVPEVIPALWETYLLFTARRRSHNSRVVRQGVHQRPYTSNHSPLVGPNVERSGWPDSGFAEHDDYEESEISLVSTPSESFPSLPGAYQQA